MAATSALRAKIHPTKRAEYTMTLLRTKSVSHQATKPPILSLTCIFCRHHGSARTESEHPTATPDCAEVAVLLPVSQSTGGSAHNLPMWPHRSWWRYIVTGTLESSKYPIIIGHDMCPASSMHADIVGFRLGLISYGIPPQQPQLTRMNLLCMCPHQPQQTRVLNLSCDRRPNSYRGKQTLSGEQGWT